MYKLDPSIKTVWTINFILKTFFYTVVLFVADFMFVKGSYGDYEFPTGTASFIILIIGIIFSIIFPQLAYKYWSFDVRENEIFLVRGIFTRVKTLAPYSKIQHIDLQQSILDRMYHIAKLVLYTAGTRGADVVIPGLPLEYAEDLRDRLKDVTSVESL